MPERLETLDAAIDAEIQAAAKPIAASVRFGEGRIRAVMNLPPPSQVDNETLALALQHILQKYFSLAFPAKEMMRVRLGEEAVSFSEEEQDPESAPRTVAIHLASTHRYIEVRGADPEDGRDACSELSFKWEKQAGVLDEHGNIDLKKLNAFPSAGRDQLLATIRFNTQGKPGIDALGKKIKPRPGRPMKLRFNEANIRRVDDPADPGGFTLRAARAGIIDFRLAQKGNPATLLALDVVDTITINGDVNYKIGDLGSLTNKDLTGAANIVVKGNVLGVFTLQSEGFIHVKGSIEGKKVMASEVVAEIIGNGTAVYGEEAVVAGTVIKASVTGRNITLRRASNESSFTARDSILLEKNCSCLALRIETHRLQAEQARFSGQNVVTLGSDLFSEEKELQARAEAIARESEVETPETRECAKNTVQHLLSLETHLGKAAVEVSSLLQMLAVIKKHIIAALQQMDKPLDANLIQACYRLQAAMGERNVHESVLRKVETLVTALRKLDERLVEQHKRAGRMAAIRDRMRELLEEAGRLSASFARPQFTGGNSEIHLLCGEEKLVLHQGNLPAGDFVVRYVIAPEGESLAAGRLVTESAAAAEAF
ncbi:MAG: flagellar assembly protein A [Thermodesulfobacteriota bacterium]